MSVQASRITVTTAATMLAGASSSGVARAARSVAVKNLGTAPVMLGGADVTAAAGYQLGPGGELTIDLGNDGGLFAIAAVNTVPVQVLQAGV